MTGQYPDMKANVWQELRSWLVKEESKVRRLKLSMMDNVSLVRNVDTVAEIITNIDTVILHDICLGNEWSTIKKHFRLKVS